MNTEVATTIFIILMAIGSVVLLWSLQMALAIGRSAEKPDWRLLDDERPSQTNTESGA